MYAPPTIHYPTWRKQIAAQKVESEEALSMWVCHHRCVDYQNFKKLLRRIHFGGQNAFAYSSFTTVLIIFVYNTRLVIRTTEPQPVPLVTDDDDDEERSTVTTLSQLKPGLFHLLLVECTNNFHSTQVFYLATVLSLPRKSTPILSLLTTHGDRKEGSFLKKNSFCQLCFGLCFTNSEYNAVFSRCVLISTVMDPFTSSFSKALNPPVPCEFLNQAPAFVPEDWPEIAQLRL